MQKVAGEARGGRVNVATAIREMTSHQILIGELNEGDVAFVKWAEDGTQLTKGETVTVATITVGNDKRALAVGTISLVMAGENYDVNMYCNVLFVEKATPI